MRFLTQETSGKETRRDVTVLFEMSGKNGFGAEETLKASRTFAIIGGTEKEAIKRAKELAKVEVLSVSVCEHK